MTASKTIQKTLEPCAGSDLRQAVLPYKDRAVPLFVCTFCRKYGLTQVHTASQSKAGTTQNQTCGQLSKKNGDAFIHTCLPPAILPYKDRAGRLLVCAFRRKYGLTQVHTASQSKAGTNSQLINQPINQSTNQPINQPINQLNNQLIN